MPYPNRAARRKAERKSRRRTDQPIFSDGARAPSWPTGTPLNIDPTSWGRDDASWFAAHPDRAHRARDPFPGERYGGPPGEVQTVVQQIAPGLRVRAAFVIAEHDPSAVAFTRDLLAIAEHDESVAATMFALAMTKAGQMVSFDEIMRMIEQHKAASARVKS